MSLAPWSLATSRQCFLFLHFVSFVCLYMPNGINWYLGNLSVYLNSYWYARLQSSEFYSSWAFSVYTLAWSFSIVIGGNIVKKIDRRILTFIGVVLFDTGIFASYFSVQFSQILFVLTFGAITGLGNGFIQSEALTRLPTLVARRIGIAFAVFGNAMNIGSMFIEWLITKYDNPDNLKANLLVPGHFNVFSQKKVIDRVPRIFIVLGILTSASHVTGLIITLALNDRGAISKNEKGKEDEIRQESVATEENFGYGDKAKLRQVPGKNRANSSAIIQNKSKNYQTLQSSSKEIELPTGHVSGSQKQSCDDTKTSTVTHDIGDIKEDLNQSQMLRSTTFYVVWFIICANDTTYIATLNFYKIYGQLWIHDDHFLTQMGIVALCTVLLTRILLGLVIDRHGVKTTQLLLSCSMSLTLAFYYFIPQINRWLYAVCTCFITGLCSTVYMTLPLMMLEFFGKSNFASKYGLMTIPTVLLNIVAPQMFQALLNGFGWFAVFVFPAALNALAMILNVWGLRVRRSCKA